MRVARIIAAVCGIGFALGLLSRSAMANGECADLAPSYLKVFTLSSGVKVEYGDRRPIPGRSIDETHTGGTNPHPYLTIIAGIGMQLGIDGTTVARGKVFCSAPRSVQIGLGLIERIVRLPAVAAADVCIRETLLRHARLHVDAVERVTEEFIASTDEPFGRTLGALKAIPAATETEARRNFDRGVRDLVARAAQALKLEQRKASQAIDTVDEVDVLRNACDGRIDLLNQIRPTRLAIPLIRRQISLPEEEM